jgi:hypothetical protein
MLIRTATGTPQSVRDTGIKNNHFSMRSTEYFLCTSASLTVGGRIVSMSISASSMCMTIFGPVNKQLTSSSERLRVSGSGLTSVQDLRSRTTSLGLTEEVDGRNEARVKYAEVNVCLPSNAADRHGSDEYDDCTAQMAWSVVDSDE